MWAGIPAVYFPVGTVGFPTESLDLTEPRPPGTHPKSAASSLCDFTEPLPSLKSKLDNSLPCRAGGGQLR